MILPDGHDTAGGHVTGPVIDATNPPSPKVWAASIAALIVPGILAALMYLQTAQGAALYASLPVVLVVLLKSLITGLITWLVAYNVTDPQRILDLAASPKVIWSTIVAVVLTAVTDVLAFLTSTEGASLYADWPPVLVVALSAVIPAVGAFLGGFIVADPARLTSKNLHPVATLPPGDVE